MSDKPQMVRNIVEKKCEHCSGAGTKYSQTLNAVAICTFCGGTGKRPATQQEVK